MAGFRPNGSAKLEMNLYKNKVEGHPDPYPSKPNVESWLFEKYNFV